MRFGFFFLSFSESISLLGAMRMIPVLATPNTKERTRRGRQRKGVRVRYKNKKGNDGRREEREKGSEIRVLIRRPHRAEAAAEREK